MPGTAAVDGPPRLTPGLVSTLLASVRDLARSAPDCVALVADDTELGYGELWQRATDLARALGDRPGVIGVEAVHSPATVVALLGVWAAGGTYCPVDPLYPTDHADAMLAAVGGCRLAEAVRGSASLGGAIAEDAAYVLFTSGSTGRPKPVAVPHRALDAVVPALVDLFGITPDDGVLQFASLNWDTAFEELLPTLAVGARVVFSCDAYTGSLSRLLRMVERREVSVLNLPTAMWHELVLHLTATGAGLPASVRLVVIGGEAASPARLAAWRYLPGTDRIRLLNTYGATETALITHATDLYGPAGATATASASEGSGDAVPIGAPLAHVVQRINPDGELLVGGPSLAIGYPGLPEATAERFVRLGNERFFRTGDLVREAHAGVLEHLGRLDAQVKVRGIRVDPGEVEALLVGHPGVSAVAVTGVTVSDHTVLAAYVVAAGPPAAEGAPELVADIRRFVRARAPGHLHPSRITVVPTLVLTVSGKVDRRATHACYRPARAGTTVPHTPRKR
jgi:non-ribosomal peptide synthetase component F